MKRSVITGMFLLAACSTGEDLAGAQRAIVKFHARLNSGQFDQIYNDSDAGLKQASSDADMTNLLSAVHTKLGSFRSATQSGWTVNYNTGGNSTVVQLESSFEKGKATETFTFVGDAKAPRLFGYNINSNALITG